MDQPLLSESQSVIGTCTLAQVINVIKESEMDRISTPWVTIRLVQLLSRCVMTEETHDEGAAGDRCTCSGRSGHSSH